MSLWNGIRVHIDMNVWNETESNSSEISLLFFILNCQNRGHLKINTNKQSIVHKTEQQITKIV